MRVIYHGSIMNELLDTKFEADKDGKVIKYVEINETERHQLMLELRRIIDSDVFPDHPLEITLTELRDTGQCTLCGLTVKYNGAAI